MQNSFIHRVHGTISGYLIEEYRVPGVECAFEDGEKCAELYEGVLKAYGRLRKRLGVMNEDADVENIIDNMMRIEKEISYRMYLYGAVFGMRDE